MWLPLQGNQIVEATEAAKDKIKSAQPNVVLNRNESTFSIDASEPHLMIRISFNNSGEEWEQMCADFTDGRHFKFKVQVMHLQETMNWLITCYRLGINLLLHRNVQKEQHLGGSRGAEGWCDWKIYIFFLFYLFPGINIPFEDTCAAGSKARI